MDMFDDLWCSQPVRVCACFYFVCWCGFDHLVNVVCVCVCFLSVDCITLISHHKRRLTTVILSSLVSAKCPLQHICAYTHTHTHLHTVKANQKFPLLSPPTSPLHSSALWHITQQHQLPDTSYQDRFGGLLIRPLKKSFLSMEGNVTPIPKAEEGGEVVMEGSGVRAWQRELPNWPCMLVLGCSPVFFFPVREVWKHPLHRHRGEAKYSFIMEGGRVVDHWTDKWKLQKNMWKGMQWI